SKFYYAKQIWNLVKSEWKILLIMFCCTIVTNGIMAYWPMLEREFVDNTLSPGIQDPGAVLRFFIIMAVSAAVLVALDCYQYFICVKAGANIGRNLRGRMYHKLQLLGMDFIHKRKAGELMNRIQGDTDRILNFMTEVFNGMFSVALFCVVILIIMLIQNAVLTLFSLGTILIVVFLFRLFFNVFHRHWTSQMRKEDAVQNRLQDVLSGMKIVKSYGMEKKETKAFEKEAGDYRKISIRNERMFATFYPLLMFLMELGIFFALYFGGRNVLAGVMTKGELLQYTTYATQLFGPLVWMTSLPRQVMQLITSMNRISDILEEEPTLKTAENPVKKEVEGEIRVEHVTFGYEAYETVLEDISFDLKKGEMLGLVGESGSGKTTTINLLMRLYDVNEGRILVDGIDIRSWDPETYHNQIGVVLQENFLFSGTILQNLLFAKPEATLEEIISACKAANAHDFICKLPDGYDTYVGEKGSTLSGGERQRISIARALLANPRILILDEATASLDTESEYQIQQAIERLIENRTTIAIAHRLSTLKNATKLIVIDSKHIAEMGSHNELLEKKGIYYGLVEAQLKMQKGE
ncbi:MAG: ABC transporter ATP-binding protein, partial [Lachnospiraceae bacterium]|nr:ABC transporter ATP-binding protein [Lachnospiraceae bacterium]